VLKKGRAEGLGVYSKADGTYYRGQWKNGAMEGYGVLSLPSGGTYTGELRGGKANGIGRYINEAGEISEGGFVDGEREGLISTTLPNGRTYQSVWSNGQETEDSSRLRLAQSTAQVPGAPSEDLRIGVIVERSKRDGDFSYVARPNDTAISITPASDRLMSMWKDNGPIQLTDAEEAGGYEYGVFSLSRGQLRPLTLIFNVQNRSQNQLSITNTYLAIQSSTSDLQPAIQLKRGFLSFDCGGLGFQPSFTLENFGWGNGERGEIRFSFTNSDAGRSFVKRIGKIERSTQVDLESELKTSGLGVEALKAKSQVGFTCSTKAPAVCLQQLRATGLFGALAPQISLKDNGIFVTASGTLNYEWSDAKGGRNAQSSPFSVSLPLGHVKIEAECGEGGERDVVGARALQLRLDQTDYRLGASYSGSIPAGQSRQFRLTLAAPKSSQHHFKLVAQLEGGREVSSRQIDLLYYLPSWFPE
jgi:hypothetical protein